MDLKSYKPYATRGGFAHSPNQKIISSQAKLPTRPPLNLSPKSPSQRLNAKISSPKQMTSPMMASRLKQTISLQLPHTSPKSLIRNSSKNKDSGQPLLPKQALTLHSSQLTKSEEQEILEYEMIYFIGSENKANTSSESRNNVYDDQYGDYNITIGDHIAYRYEILKLIGKGTFGTVLECFDHKRHEKVAIKIIKNKKKFYLQGLTEVKILQNLRENDLGNTNNVVKMKNYFMFRNHVCISFELLSCNLYEIIQQNRFEGLSIKLINRFAVQILTCLQYLLNQKVIHCDLKPENILLKDLEKASIKVIDFGSSCFEQEKVHSYIQSRYYRAPEVILGINYTTAIDMWSFGCVLAELFTGKPLFPGENERDQLFLMVQLIGLPNKLLLAKASKKEFFFDENGNFKFKNSNNEENKSLIGRRLEDVLIGATDSFVDFIRKCLVWEPKERMRPLEGLGHIWIRDRQKRKIDTE